MLTRLLDKLGRGTAPAYKRRLPGLFWCSLAYLIVELAFSAQLLELAGSSIDADRLNSIEYVGRTLSGIAVSLFLISYVVKRYRPGVGRYLRVLIVTMVTIACVWGIQEMVIDGVVDGMASGEGKLEASLVLTTTTDLLRNGHITIPSLDLTDEVLASPDGLSFMAMFPALALSHPTIVADLKPLLPNALKRSLILSCDVALPCLGTPEQFLNERWPEMRDSLDALYNEYDKARQPLTDPPPQMLRRHAGEAWIDYNISLGSRGFKYDTAPKDMVRQSLRRKGLRVPDNWQLDDYEGFERAVRGKIMRDARPAFHSFSRKLLGHPDLPPDLDRAGFFKRADVQKLVWQRRGVLEDETDSLTLPVLDAAATDDGVMSRIYADLLEFQSQYMANNLSRETASKPYGEWYKSSKQAAESVVVPPIALGFSILGALAHIAKIMGYLLGRRMARKPAVLIASTVVLVFGLLIFFIPSNITGKEPYGVFETQTAEQLGSGTAWSLRFIIQAEALLYPVNNLIHRVILRDFDFGQF